MEGTQNPYPDSPGDCRDCLPQGRGLTRGAKLTLRPDHPVIVQDVHDGAAETLEERPAGSRIARRWCRESDTGVEQRNDTDEWKDTSGTMGDTQHKPSLLDHFGPFGGGRPHLT